MNPRSLATAELTDRIGWLIRLRWVAIAGVAVTVAVATLFFHLRLALPQLGAALLVLAVYNLAGHAVARRLRRHPEEARPERASAFANAQIAMDLVCLAALLHFSGGLENPFIFYFIFHVIIASILLSRKAAFRQATLAVALVTALGLGEYAGLLRHYYVPGLRAAGSHENLSFVAANLFVIMSTLYIAAYMGTSITGRLRQREREVSRLTADLQTAYERLSQIEQMKSSYMRKVSHELRSPLAAIQTTLRVILDGLAGELGEKSREMVERAERRTHGLLKVTNDLLILSRAQDARLPEQMGPVDLREVVERVTALLSPRAEGKEVRVVTSLPDGLPSIRGDREALEQLLTNLVANGIKYTPAGGTVCVSGEDRGDSVQLLVADTGIGVPAADIPKIFDEFYRGQSAREFAGEGTGLGLSIVNAIVAAHRGTIEVTSELGKGTTFAVSLPRHA